MILALRAKGFGASLRRATRRNATPRAAVRRNDPQRHAALRDAPHRNAPHRNATLHIVTSTQNEVYPMTIRTATARLIGVSAYSPSRKYDDLVPRLEKESSEDYDKRTWREHANYDPKTREMFIPPMGLKLAIAEAAKRLAIKIPGKGKATYTKNVLSGVIAADRIWLGVKMEDAAMEAFPANSDGRRGSGSRVTRRFPILHEWEATAILQLIDDEVPQEVFERCLREAGNLIGVGRFRPQQGGYFGRFTVKGVKWAADDLREAAE
jgi:hypothetical protein